MFHVKPNLSLDALIQFLKHQNIHLSTRQNNQLHIFHSEILIWSEKMNLISSGDKRFLIERHFLPSFYYLHFILNDIQLFGNNILDFGTGAGFPGVILAIGLPNIKITLLDSSRKKTLFLKNLLNRLGIKFEIICDRIEDIQMEYRSYFDLIVARAVASVSILAEKCIPLLKKEGSILTLKGIDYTDELSNDRNLSYCELVTVNSWITFSNYLYNKRMIKINK